MLTPIKDNESSERNHSSPELKCHHERPDLGRRRQSPNERFGEQKSRRRSPPAQSPFIPYSPSIRTPTISSRKIPFALVPPLSVAMTRTPSGNSIISSPAFEPPLSPVNAHLLTDQEAAHRLKAHLRRRHPRTLKHSHYLRHLLNSNRRLDDTALDSILTTADTVFFDGALRGRVRWEWSSPTETRYKSELIGTTALREAIDKNGFETLIILSRPILKSKEYHRELLLSAFMHELVHCYLFVCCGFEARRGGGHTNGFGEIVRVIDEWVGKGVLKLCDITTRLEDWVVNGDEGDHDQGFYGSDKCNEFGQRPWSGIGERHSSDGCEQQLMWRDNGRPPTETGQELYY